MKLNVLYLFFILRVCISQENLGMTYLTRWKKAGLCEPSKVMTFESASVLYEGKEYLNGVINVTRDFTAERITVQLRKCGEGYYPCENFMLLKGDRGLLNNILKTPGQTWSTLSSAIKPKFTAAHVKKGIYTITNATLDIEKAMIVMPEFPNYYWKVVINCWDKNDALLLCTEAEFHVIKYTPRDKKTRRNG